MDLTGADVQDILQLIDSMPVRELHLKTTRFTLTLRRADDGEWTQELQLTSAPNVLANTGAPASPDGLQKPADADPPASAPVHVTEPDAGGAAIGVQGVPGSQSVPAVGAASGSGILAAPAAVVAAPLLGTFYRAPRPGAPPFVEVGSRVDPDTVVGIIETMKLMNSVSAGLRGTVTEILVADAQFTPQGAALMRVATDAVTASGAEGAADADTAAGAEAPAGTGTTADGGAPAGAQQ
jgi:acetyl-CoA carboxylase biotin carboxyl carrier protein